MICIASCRRRMKHERKLTIHCENMRSTETAADMKRAHKTRLNLNVSMVWVFFRRRLASSRMPLFPIHTFFRSLAPASLVFNEFKRNLHEIL